MLRALNTAATGMSAQEQNVSVISNNIANVNTNAYKKSRTEFDDLMYETLQEPGARSGADTQYNVGVQLGSGAKVSGTRKLHEIGNPQVTNDPFDLMINGEGFFGVILPNNQVKFTRDGSFSVDAQGGFVDKSGNKVFPGITLPPGVTTVNISRTGQVEAFLKNQVEPQNVGSIAVFTFVNPAGLRSEGGNHYAETAASGQPTQQVAGENGSGEIQQGVLESSNVNIVNEMTNLIKAQRAYEMNSKVLGVADQILQNTNNIR